jgi:hypothetical protein
MSVLITVSDVHAGGGAENQTCPGWLLEITAI